MNFINYVDFPGQSFQTLDLQDRQTHRQMRLKTLARRIGSGKKTTINGCEVVSNISFDLITQTSTL